MNNNKIDEINKLLETKPELKTDKVYERDIEFIKEVLDMPEWNDPKFKEVLTPNIWRSNIKDIKTVLHLPEWDEPKFKHLLTPNIWRAKTREIKEILHMPYWDDPKFKHLLTSTIWNSNSKKIKDILSMPEWNKPQFKDLLNSEDAIGKKLDFIIQEMNRETNTIGSKSVNLEITNKVIDIKTILEDIREQIQNIE